jgi:hypothetical protein
MKPARTKTFLLSLIGASTMGLVLVAITLLSDQGTDLVLSHRSVSPSSAGPGPAPPVGFRTAARDPETIGPPPPGLARAGTSYDPPAASPIPFLQGTVVDRSGLPVTGGLVWILGPRPHPRAVTDSTGAFQFFEQLPPGPVVLLATAPGYVDGHPFPVQTDSEPRIVLDHGATVSGEVLPAPGQPSYPCRVWLEDPLRVTEHGSPEATQVVAEDGTFRIDGVPPGTYVVRAKIIDGPGEGGSAPLLLEEGAVVEDLRISIHPALPMTGRILDGSTMEPVAGATIEASRSETAAREAVREDDAGIPKAKRGTESDADGVFSLQAPWDTEALVVRHHLFLPAVVSTGTSSPSGDASDILLRPGGTLRGTAWTEEGLPWIGVAVGLVDHRSPLPVRTTSTRADGSFEMKGLLPGPYDVGAFLPRDSSEIPFPELVTSRPVTILEGEVSLVDLGGSFLQGTLVHGLIAEEEGPLAGWRVELYSLQPDGHGGLAFPRVETSGASGDFAFPGVAPGRHVLATQVGGVPVEIEFEVGTEADTRVDLEVPSTSLRIHVVDAVTGLPIEGTMVTVRRDGITAGSRTSVSGMALFGCLPEGPIDVEVCSGATLLDNEEGAREVVRQTATLTSRTETTMEIRLRPGASLEGTVHGRDGEPVLHPTIVLQLDDGARAGLQLLGAEDPSGFFRVVGLAPGRYTLRVEATGFRGLVEPFVPVLSGSRNRFDAVMDRE